jgi:hypothetical protein
VRVPLDRVPHCWVIDHGHQHGGGQPSGQAQRFPIGQAERHPRLRIGSSSTLGITGVGALVLVVSFSFIRLTFPFEVTFAANLAPACSGERRLSVPPEVVLRPVADAAARI